MIPVDKVDKLVLLEFEEVLELELELLVLELRPADFEPSAPLELNPGPLEPLEVEALEVEALELELELASELLLPDAKLLEPS